MVNASICPPGPTFTHSVVGNSVSSEKERGGTRTRPDPALRREAVASIEGKAYHVAGACILATFLPSAAAEHYIEIVAPLETIYDYLDNLCDRLPNVPPAAPPMV